MVTIFLFIFLTILRKSRKSAAWRDRTLFSASFTSTYIRISYYYLRLFKPGIKPQDDEALYAFFSITSTEYQTRLNPHNARPNCYSSATALLRPVPICSKDRIGEKTNFPGLSDEFHRPDADPFL